MSTRRDAAYTESPSLDANARIADDPRHRPALVETFNTHLIAEETLLALRTAREDEAADVMNAIARNRRAVPGRLQHVAVYGPRGFGKSFLIRLVQIEVERMAADGAPLVYVLLPEEQHNLTRNPHALLGYLAARLADRRRGNNSSWEQAAFKWPKPGQEAALWDGAAARLEQELDATFADARGLIGDGLAVAVVENFDILLATVFKSEVDEQRLRKWLGRDGNRMMLLATGTGTADIDYERPLFQALQNVRLEPWTQDECIGYFNRRRVLERRDPLDPRQEAKARAISDFIGGNPRLAQLLGDVLDTEDALNVAETMNALADRLADYYRRRIDDLPPLAQGLLDALIRGGEPCSATELAARVGAIQSDIARVMQDLKRADIIRGVPVPQFREMQYRVIDRVFVHFYRLRQGEAKARSSPLLTILDFLRGFYSRDEMRTQASRYLDIGRSAEAGVFGRLSLEGTAASEFKEEFRLRLPAYTLADPTTVTMPVARIVAQLDDMPEQFEPNTAVRGDGAVGLAIVAVLEAQRLCRIGLTERAEEVLKTALVDASDDAAAIVIVAIEYTHFIAHERHDKVEMLRILALAAAQASAKTLPASLSAVALTLYAGQRCKDPKTAAEALVAADQAISKAAQLSDLYIQAMAQMSRCVVLVQLQRFKEAVAAGDAATALAERVAAHRLGADAAFFCGFTLTLLGRYADALDRTVLAFDLFSAIGDIEAWNRAARFTFVAGAYAPCPRAVALYERWIDHNLAAAAQIVPHVAGSSFGDLLGAVTRANLWAEFDTFLARRSDWIAAQVELGEGAGMGAAVAAKFAAVGRAEAFATARALFARLNFLGTSLHRAGASRTPLLSWLHDIVSAFATECRDPGLMRDIAGLFEDALMPDAATVRRLLLELADFDGSGGNPAKLLRLDPDVATWIQRIRKVRVTQTPVTPPPTNKVGHRRKLRR